jgi:hypothetical protein
MSEYCRTIQIKRGSSSTFQSENPILQSGELAWEKDTNKIKVGDGITQWNDLPYINNDFEINDVLIFKGTLGIEGTVTTLPSIYNAGWSYKVITAGTYANKVCEVGDLIIAIEDRPDGDGNDNDWTVVQANIENVVTISNAGNNRLLTSDGTNTGIDAESNLTFDERILRLQCECSSGNAGFVGVGDGNIVNFRANQFFDGNVEPPRLIFRRARGSESSPQIANANDGIFAIRGETVDYSGNIAILGGIRMEITDPASSTSLNPGAKIFLRTSSGGDNLLDKTLTLNSDGTLVNTGQIKVFDTPVSLEGHTHTYSEIENSPTINNPGNNRILTSDGSSYGIVAEDQLVFDPNDNFLGDGASLIIKYEVPEGQSGTNFLKFKNYGRESVGSCGRIQFEKYRGTEEAPQILQNNDFMGVIRFLAPAATTSDGNVARIAVFADGDTIGSGLTPTRLLLQTSSGDQNRFDNTFTIFSDNRITTNCDLTIATGKKVLTYQPGNPYAFSVYNSSGLDREEATRGCVIWNRGVVQNNDDPKFGCSVGAGTFYGLLSVPSGVASTGVGVNGIGVGVFRNSDNSNIDDGIADYMVGVNVDYGHAVIPSGDPTTRFARGLSITPWAGAGIIELAYDIYLGDTNTVDYSAETDEIVTGDGSITDRYGIVQQSSDPNFLNGSLTVDGGLLAKTPIFNANPLPVLNYVLGNVPVNFAINKQIQQFSVNGSATAFDLGSSWPSDGSVDVLLEINVMSSTLILWNIVNDWYSMPESTLSTGVHLFLLRSFGNAKTQIGNTVNQFYIQGHYIGKKQ